MSLMRRGLTVGILAIAGLTLLAGYAQAQEFVTRRKVASFDDIRFELGNAVVTRGLNIQTEGNLEAMLKRTGADLGATTAIYKNAQFIEFCSAVLTRKLVELDADAIGYCPFQVFVYETIAKPGEIVVGFRRHTQVGGGSTPLDAAKAAVDETLSAIIADAVK